MTTSLGDLIAQKDALERQIRVAQTQAKTEAVAQVHELMSLHGLTPADLVAPARKQGGKSGAKVEPKYRDPATGSTWSGRGLKPKWLTAAIEAGKSIQDFAL